MVFAATFPRYMRGPTSVAILRGGEYLYLHVVTKPHYQKFFNTRDTHVIPCLVYFHKHAPQNADVMLQNRLLRFTGLRHVHILYQRQVCEWGTDFEKCIHVINTCFFLVLISQTQTKCDRVKVHGK
jgi:hypothetical protein